MCVCVHEYVCVCLYICVAAEELVESSQDRAVYCMHACMSMSMYAWLYVCKQEHEFCLCNYGVGL